MDVDDRKRLTAQLEAALARELVATWHQINQTFFKGALAPPTVELTESRATLGRWIGHTRTIEVSRALVLEQPWGAVVEVIKHEAAHQYVHEVLGETAQTAHGPAFQDTCARLGIDARASGVPRTVEETQEAKVVERIARLLALAESPNQHEAEAAALAAQRLMLKYNLDRARTAEPRSYEFVHLGRPSGRILEHERLVAMILTRHFFVDSIWVRVYKPLEGRRGTVLEVCGTRANLSIAEYVHAFLHQTGDRLWREHQRSRNISSNRERRTFLAGVMTGFADTLSRQAVRSRSEGLVWVGDGDLSRYLRRRHPNVRHVRHAGQHRNEAWVHGREAGRKIVLSRPVEAGAAWRGRLLPAKP